MTTAQMICLAAIAAIVIIYVVGQVTRPKISGDDIIRAVSGIIIMAQQENRCLSVKISDREIDIFCGTKGTGDEPQTDGRESVLWKSTSMEGHDQGEEV